MQDFNYIIPELIIVLLILSQVLFQKSKHTIMFILLALVALMYQEVSVFAFNNSWYLSHYTKVSKVLILGSFIIYLVFHKTYFELKKFEHITLCSFAVLGFMISLSANDFALLYLGLEMSAISCYVLIIIDEQSVVSVESSIKYFMMGSLASIIILYGVSIIYAESHSISYDVATLLLQQNENTIITLGVILVIVAFLLKISAAPFHFWIIDIYEGSPKSTLLFFVTVIKLSLLLVLINICLIFQPYLISASNVFKIFGFLSVFIGGFGALTQTSIKKFIGYTSILNTGYMLLSINMGEDGIVSAITYCIFYVIGYFSVFAILLTHDYFDTIDNIKYISQNKFLSVFMMFILCSFIGLPPFAGFFTKIMIFESLIEKQEYFFVSFIALMTLVSFSYYFRIVQKLFLDEVDAIILKKVELSKYILVLITGFFILSLYFGPNLVSEMIRESIVIY